MTEANDQIPTHGEHRGVGLHAGQSDARLAVVRRDIDAVHALSDLEALYAFAVAPRNAPEARLFARAKALAILDDAIERRAPRDRTPVVSRERIRASAVGLNLMTCRCSTHYCSKWDTGQPPGGDGRVLREVPLD